MANDGRSRTWLWVPVGGAAFVLFFLAVFGLVYVSLRGDQKTDFSSHFGDKIGVLELEGVIIDPREFIKDLKKFGEDDSIKAIILHINTPGGGAAASEEIYREVVRVRDQKKKRIVSSIETLGASGGYYVASASNKIFADDASIVGSIGVIAEQYNYGDLRRWAKLKNEVIKAGALKDTGNPARDMTPEERAYMQQLIDDMHGLFIRAAVTGH